LVDGGNDVLNGGPGYDALFGNGGDDIFFMGDGIDTAQGDGGFDWLDYELNVRFDNGTASVPGVFMDLSATIANPVPGTTEDQVTDIEGLSGSAGNDVLIGRLANDVTVARVITGIAGGTTLVMPGTVTGIDAGMRVTGNGIGRYATTVAQARTSTVNGSTVTTVDLTDQNSANVTGPVTFTIWPLEHPALITGLTEVLSHTPGWTKHTVSAPSATIWSGGTILLGGDGNDVLQPISGENVMHGSAYLHTCIKVTHAGFGDTGADVNCAGGRGYSTMTALGALMDNGTLSPTDLSIVRELVSTSVSVTAYSATGSSITFTSNHHFRVGESVSIFGISNARYNVVNAIVTAADGTSFTVNSNAPQVTSTSVTGASAVATDTVALPGTVDQYAIVPFTPLPAGVLAAYKIISKDGSVDIVFDVQMVSFAGAAAVPIAASMPALTSLTFSTGTLTPTFTPNTLNYGLEVAHSPSDVTSVTLTAVSAAVGATIKYRKGTTGGFTNTASNSPFTVSGLSTAGPTTIEVVVTAIDGITSTTYSIVVTHAGLVPAMTEHATATTSEVVITVTNYEAGFTFTSSVATSTPHSPAVTVTVGTPNGTNLPITVSNLLPSETATVTVSTTRSGYTNASATKVVGATAGGALVATFGNVVPTTDGFTVPVTNYSAQYSLAITSNAGSVSRGAPTGSNLPLTITGLSVGQSATITVVATRTGYADGTSTVVGNATQGAALTPTLSAAAGTSTGFTFTVTNYDQTYSYAATTNHGSVVPGTPSGTSLPFTVSGLALGASATVTVVTNQAGRATGTATITSNANPLNSGGTITIVGTPTSSSVGSRIALSITSTGQGQGAVTYVTSTSNCFINGTNLTATAAANCSVVATQAADSSYAAVTSSPTVFVFDATAPGFTAQAPLTLSGSAAQVTVGTSITLSASGGSSSGSVVYFTSSAGCMISGQSLTASVAGTCDVIAIKNGDSTYAGVLSGTVSFLFSATNLRPQAALSVSGSPSTTTVGSSITLSSAGGTGGGSVSLSTSTSGCSISGNVLTSSVATGCVVIISKASDGTYASSTAAATFNFTNVVDPGTFAFTNGVFSVTGGTSVTLIAAGGTGTGKVSYNTTTPNCLVRGAILTVTAAPVSCVVNAVKANVSPITITQTFSFTQRPQALLRITNAKTTGLAHTSRVTLTVAGGSGTGAITYSVSGTGCSVSGASLTASQATTCVVTAYKAASTIYADATPAILSFIFSS